MARILYPRACWWAALIITSISMSAGAQAPLKFTVPLTAKVEGEKLVGVEFTGHDKVKFIPGDEVTIKFEGGKDFDAEFWSRRYSWKKKEKRGKKTIITPMIKDAEVTWSAKWGAGIDGALAFANGPEKSDVVKHMVSKLSNAKPIKIVQKVDEVKLEFTVRPDPDRVVDKPADVPANAIDLKATPIESMPPKIVPLVSHGADLGKLVITVTRPSGK